LEFLSAARNVNIAGNVQGALIEQATSMILGAKGKERNSLSNAGVV
jgi:hypothetical protein